MKKLLSILLLVLIAAKFAAVLARGPVPLERDALGYWRLSTLAMSGDILMLAEPIAYRTPAYPWFLAFVRTVAGPSALMVVTAIQASMCVAAIWIAAVLAARISNLPGAMVWTLLAALPAVSSATFAAAILTESLFLFLFMLNLLAVHNYAKHGTARRAIWVGITFAMTLLTRPIVVLLWIPHLCLLLYVQRRRKRRLGKHMPKRYRFSRLLRDVAVAGLTVTCLLAPWLMRNYTLFGKPLLTEFVGRNLWVVTFQDGSGAGLELPENDDSRQLQRRLDQVGSGDQWRATWAVSLGLVKSGLNDVQADQLMNRVAIAAIKSDQEVFRSKAIRRVVNFWRCAATDLPPQGQEGPFYGQQTWRASLPQLEWLIEKRLSGSVLFNTALLALLAVSSMVLVFSHSTRPYGVWIALIFAYFTLVTGILEIPAYRYRMVLEPLVAGSIGSAFAVLLSRRRRPASLDAG